jgi:hypothetical protein
VFVQHRGHFIQDRVNQGSEGLIQHHCFRVFWGSMNSWRGGVNCWLPACYNP